MGDNLNSLSQIVTTAFFVNNTFVNTSCCNVIGFSCLDAQKTFVMSQIEVGFVSVYRYITFTMFIRIQSSRINIDIRIELLNCYIIASGLQ